MIVMGLNREFELEMLLVKWSATIDYWTIEVWLQQAFAIHFGLTSFFLVNFGQIRSRL
jgi:hypothetical protein